MNIRMIAVVFTMHPAPLSAWFGLTCLLGLIAMPIMEWLGRAPQRRRLAVMLCAAFVVSGVMVSAIYPCPGCLDDCCPDYIPYGICWPIGWWPC